MRSTDWGALVVITVAVFLATASGVSFVSADVSWGVFWLMILGIWVAYVGLTSFYRIPPDKMLATVFIGTMQEVCVNGNFPRERGGERGLWGMDVVLLPYPLWYGVFFPTTMVKLIIHATTVYLKECKSGDDIKSPGVPVRVDVTILLRLAPNLGQFAQAINVLSRGEYDLAHETTIRDNLWKAGDEENDRHEYSSPRLAQLVLDSVSETVWHSVRSVASENYTWKELAGEGQDNVPFDIKGSIPQFAQDVKKNLGQEGSVFLEAGILRAEGEEVYRGPSVVSFDLRVADVSPEDKRFREALHEPMIADLERDADRLRGIGEGDRLAQKAGRSNVAPETIVQSETLQNVNEVKLFGAGDKLTDLVKKLLGGD